MVKTVEQRILSRSANCSSQNQLEITPAKSQVSSGSSDDDSFMEPKSDDSVENMDEEQPKKRSSTGQPELEYPEHSYWRYYIRNKSKCSAECRLCSRVIQMGNKASTGGLMRHLKTMHKQVFAEFQQIRARQNMAVLTLLNRVKKEANENVDGEDASASNMSTKQSRKQKVVRDLKFEADDESPRKKIRNRKSKTQKVLEEKEQPMENVMMLEEPMEPSPEQEGAGHTELGLHRFTHLFTPSTEAASTTTSLGAGLQQSLNFLLFGGSLPSKNSFKEDEQTESTSQPNTSFLSAISPHQQSHIELQEMMKPPTKHLDFGHSLDKGGRKGSSVENFVANSSKHLQQMISSVAAATIPSATQSVPSTNGAAKIFNHSLTTPEIITRLGHARVKLQEALTEIETLEGELVHRQQQDRMSFSE